MTHITTPQFTDRFATMILAGRVLPKKPVDLHILFKSATLGLKANVPYSENELNDALRPWSSLYGDNFGLDHVTMRRNLVDEGYLLRDPAGDSYELVSSQPVFTFDPDIESLDLDQVIFDAREARELQKQTYLNRPDA